MKALKDRTLAAIFLAGTVFSAWAGNSSYPAAATAAETLRCDDSIKTRFKPDGLTTVIAVKSFRKGDPLVISEPDPRVTTSYTCS